MRFCIQIFVSGLSGLCEHLRVSEDVYAVGHTSRIIATEFANLPSARARRKVSCCPVGQNLVVYY